MADTLHAAQLEGGAQFDDGTEQPAHFGDAVAELQACRAGVALVDLSDLGRIRSQGPDLLELLNRLSTGKVIGLAPSGGAETVITNNKGRIVARLFVHRSDTETTWLVTGRGEAPAVIEHLDRFTFAERTGLEDRTAGSRQFGLIGPHADRVLQSLDLERPAPLATISTALAGLPVQGCGHDGLSRDGLSWIVAADGAAEVWAELTRAVRAAGGRPAGQRAHQAWRILRGLPAAGHELTDEANPLEAGLIDAVSFDKGCYVGQEVVARLKTYDKVSRELVGLRLPAEAPVPSPGTKLRVDGADVGRITSAVTPPGWNHPVALGYLKRRVTASEIMIASEPAASSPVAERVPLPFPVEPDGA